MRLDKYLKLSRLVKRRTVANELCDAGKVTVNNKVSKASYEVKIGDILGLKSASKEQKFRILQVMEHVPKDAAKDLYEALE
ncbi:MAG: RNA-binding S4 domain-containing protein [Oscillospiraceae bacterium]|nr:RNA-binding S4 domain-containing protein [Oscillospiraceae bacterium]